MFEVYYLGICPNNLNGNHQAWCHSIEVFETREERDSRANELWEDLADTCNTVHCWEEPTGSDTLPEDSLTTMNPEL